LKKEPKTFADLVALLAQRASQMTRVSASFFKKKCLLS
jgi:hypothetical protein